MDSLDFFYQEMSYRVIDWKIRERYQKNMVLQKLEFKCGGYESRKKKKINFVIVIVLVGVYQKSNIDRMDIYQVVLQI